jgi:hypothetical protein
LFIRFDQDLPASKLIEFKFLLQDTSGKLQWQSGPNRSLQTCERTVDTLVVYEDWDDVKNQKIEEAEASIGMEAVVSDDNESRKAGVVEDELRMDGNKEVEQDEAVIAEEDEESTVCTSDSILGESMKANKADPPKVCVELNEVHQSLPFFTEHMTIVAIQPLY